MANDRNYWTSPRGRMGAGNRRGREAKTPSRVFDTQREAWDYSRDHARGTGGEAFFAGP